MENKTIQQRVAHDEIKVLSLMLAVRENHSSLKNILYSGVKKKLYRLERIREDYWVFVSALNSTNAVFGHHKTPFLAVMHCLDSIEIIESDTKKYRKASEALGLYIGDHYIFRINNCAVLAHHVHIYKRIPLC